MRAVLICNPNAGRGRALRLFPSLVDEFERQGVLGDAWLTEGPGHATDLARAAREAGLDTVIAAGGDGTVHETVNGFLAAETGPPAPRLFHIPVGTGCDFARSLGLSLRPRALATSLPTAVAHDVDVAWIVDLDNPVGPRRWFVNGLNLGIGAGVLRRLARSRVLSAAGRHGYVLAAGLEILEGPREHLEMSIDDGPTEAVEVMHLAVANGGFVGGGLRLPGGAGLATGSLEVVRIAPMGTLAALFQLRRAMTGTIVHPAISRSRFSRLTVVGARDGFEVDGELVGLRDFSVALSPGGLTVLLPGPD